MLLICRVWCIGGAREGGGSWGLCTGCKPLCPGRQPLSFRSVMQYQFFGTVFHFAHQQANFLALMVPERPEARFWKQIFKNFTGGVTPSNTHPITALGCARGASSPVLGPTPSSCVSQQEQTPGAATGLVIVQMTVKTIIDCPVAVVLAEAASKLCTLV